MTEISMTVREYLRKAGIDLDGDFLAQAAALVAQATMELEVTQQIGAAKHERTAARQTQRNGYREREWATRAGTSRCAFRSCGRAATFRACWTAAAGRAGAAGGSAAGLH